MSEIIELEHGPRYHWRVTPVEHDCVMIEAVNHFGVGEQEIVCTRAQARDLAALLAQQ